VFTSSARRTLHPPRGAPFFRFHRFLALDIANFLFRPAAPLVEMFQDFHVGRGKNKKRSGGRNSPPLCTEFFGVLRVAGGAPLYYVWGFFLLPYLNNLHYAGLIQWARGDVHRRTPLDSGVLRVARGGSGAKTPPLVARPVFEDLGSMEGTSKRLTGKPIHYLLP